MSGIKGLGDAKNYNGADLRIGILHARWNTKIIDALITGAKKTLTAAGVREENIILQSVPGSYELPYAAQRMYASSQLEATKSAGGALLAGAADLLGASASQTDLTKGANEAGEKAKKGLTGAFDAIIAVGCLIKGETMHFEYIADAVSHGLMRVQLDAQVPVVFGLLTVLTEEQGLARAGLTGKGHNHGEDWGAAAVELAIKRKGWAEGKFVD